MYKSTIENFRARRVVYNRNGIGGEPFYTVYFSYEESGVFMPSMLAVLPFEGKSHQCMVVDLQDATQCWRGEHFFEFVAPAIKAHEDELAKPRGSRNGLPWPPTVGV